MMVTTMAIDQFGHAYHDLGAFPRAALMKRLGRKTAKKMYRDHGLGGTIHCGYIIDNLWLTIYNVQPWKGKA